MFSRVSHSARSLVPVTTLMLVSFLAVLHPPVEALRAEGGRENTPATPTAASNVSVNASSEAMEVMETARDAENKHLWKPRTRTVAVFKNGLAFFTQEATVSLRDGWCYAREVPPAAFGTLAIYATNPNQVVDIVGTGPGEIIEFNGVHEEADIATKRKYLDASRGLDVLLHYQRKDGHREVSGQLSSVDERFAIVEQDQQALAVPLAEITRLQLLHVPLRVHVSEENEANHEEESRNSTRNASREQANKRSNVSSTESVDGNPSSPRETRIGMAYLRKGLMWIPEYTLEILDDDTAELTLRGTLINEAEDLVNCDVQFVVGVPHFAHSDLFSPIAVGRTLRAIGAGIPRQDIPPQVMSQMMNRAAITSNTMVSPAWDQAGDPHGTADPSLGIDLGDLLNQLPTLKSTAASDYSVYTKSGLTVRRGERASVRLFTRKVRYRHQYRWETSGAVEHLLLLDNRGTTPWTTGPCLAISGVLPLSEDVLKYTPAGGSGELPVTTAINLSHSVREEESDRQLKAHSPRNHEFYDLVTVRGSIRLKSFERSPVEIQVIQPIQGKPTKADNDGMIRADVTQLRLLDRRGTIHWKVTLDPQQETTLHYEYERYVPSH